MDKQTEIEVLLANRISCLNNETIIELWNKFADEFNKDYITENDSEGLGAIIRQYKTRTDNIGDAIEADGLLYSMEMGLWRREDKYITIDAEKNLIISFNEARLTEDNPIIDTDSLSRWIALKVGRNYSSWDIASDEIFGLKAYTFINTAEYNEDGKYSVKTKEYDGIPLFDVEGWDMEDLITMKVGDKLDGEFKGAMVIRVQ